MNSTVLPRAAPNGRSSMILSVSLGEVTIQQKLHRESFPADGTSVETGGMAGEVQLQLELRAAADAAEDAARYSAAGDTRRGHRTSRQTRATVHQGNGWRVHAANVRRHLGLAPKEAPTLDRRVPRRVLVVGQDARAAPIDPALLAMFHREVHLYRHLGIEGVPTKRATVQMMSVALQQVPLKEIRMRIKLLAGAASVLLTDLTQVVLDEMGQHVFAIRERSVALRARMPGHFIAVIGLQVPCQMFPKRFKVLQGGAALAAQQGTGGVAATGVRAGPDRMLVRKIGRLWRAPLRSLRSCVSRGSVVNAVHLRLAVLDRRCRRRATALAMLKNVVLGVGGRR